MGCLDKELKRYDDEYDDEYRAMRRICQQWNIYYNKDLHTKAKGGRGIDFLLGSYFSQLNLSQNSAKTYDDTISEEEHNLILTEEDFQEAKEAGTIKISEKTRNLWGFGFEPEDYTFLENSYSDWKAKVVIDGKAKETLVRELCVIKLQQNKALQGKEIDLYEKLSRLYQKTLDSASLKPAQEEANEKSGEKPIGVMIEMFEKERPIPKPDPEWEDVDGIIKFITVYFLGHLSKMLKLKNKYTYLYEEEMAKYRVEIPELESADDEDVFDYIISGGDSDESIE